MYVSSWALEVEAAMTDPTPIPDTQDDVPDVRNDPVPEPAEDDPAIADQPPTTTEGVPA